jgi:putative hydrolase of the HAD superfamily
VPLVIFDLDNTLIDRSGAFSRWAVRFAGEHGLEPREADWLEAADGDGFTPREEFLSAVRDRYGIVVSLDDFREQIVALVEPDPAVPPVLDALHTAGWRVAIATNGTTAQQMAKIRRTGLDANVDAIAVSEEVGVAKPDPRMFEAAARRCGARLADGGWMIGDCATRDIAGGQGVGLRTIWMRRGRTWDPSIPPPDAAVDELPATLAVLRPGAARGGGTPCG